MGIVEEDDARTNRLAWRLCAEFTERVPYYQGVLRSAGQAITQASESNVLSRSPSEEFEAMDTLLDLRFQKQQELRSLLHILETRIKDWEVDAWGDYEIAQLLSSAPALDFSENLMDHLRCCEALAGPMIKSARKVL